MQTKGKSPFRVPPRGERGQFLPWIALLMVSMLGIAGLSIDLGRAYVLRQQLQNVANAAALAAANQVYLSSTTSQANAIANKYGGGTYNQISGAVEQYPNQLTKMRS